MKRALLVCLGIVCLLSSCGAEPSSNAGPFYKVKYYIHVGHRYVNPYWVEREEFMKYYPVDLPVEIEDNYVSIEGGRISYPVKGSDKKAYVEFILQYNFDRNDPEYTPTTLANGWISFFYKNDPNRNLGMYSILVSDHSYISSISVEYESKKTSIINRVEMNLYDLCEWDANGLHYYGEFMYNDLYFTCSFRNYSDDEVVGMLEKIVKNSSAT